MALVATIAAGGALPSQAREGVTPTVVRVADLTQSSRPAGVAWLDGRVLHTAAGGTRALPWTRAAARARSLRILGHTPRGWLVKDFSDSAWNVWLVRGDHRERLSSTGVSEGDVVAVTPSTDHHRYAVTDFDGDSTALVVVRNLHGKAVASRTFDGNGAVLDFSGPEAVVGNTATQRWWIDDPEHPGSGSLTDLGADGVAASLEHDLLLVRDSGSGEVGPTSLSSPGVPSWTAPMAGPRISPDGDRIVARTDAHSLVYDVLTTSDGALEVRLQIDFPAPETPLWATDRAFVLLGATHGSGDRERLLRCTVGGHCRGQSHARARDRISVPPI